MHRTLKSAILILESAILMFVAVGVGLLVSLFAAADAGAADAEGQIIDFGIEPAVTTIQSGDTITFTNTGARPHTVTDRGGLFDTNPLLPGESGAVTPMVPGTYEIFCRLNPSTMNARIVVEPSEASPSSVRIQAFDPNREGAVLSFDNPNLEVPVGTELILSNVGGLPHSLRADDDSFRIAVVEPGAERGRFPGGSKATILTTAGTFGFYCEIHPAAMRGTITVTPLAADQTPPTEEERPPVAPPPAPPPTEGGAKMEDFAFSPVELSAEPGAQVVWTNTGAAPHTATFDDPIKLDTGRVEAGASATLTAPTEPGTYSYFCAIHPDMRGALRVLAPAAVVVAPPPAPAAPPDGTLFAYVLAAALLGTGVGGLALALRGKPGEAIPDAGATPSNEAPSGYVQPPVTYEQSPVSYEQPPASYEQPPVTGQQPPQPQ